MSYMINKATILASSNEGRSAPTRRGNDEATSRHTTNRHQIMESMQVAEILYNRGYRVGTRIGKGSYAKVKVVQSVSDQAILAAKIISRRKAAKEFTEKFLPRELSIILSLDHANVAQVYEVIEAKQIVCVIMEYAANGDLLDYIKKRGYLLESEAATLFTQIASAVLYLHGLRICHRDLKCENVLLRKDMTVALSDFGFARVIHENEPLSNTYCGSTAYASPELLRGKPYNPFSNDIWSIGCIVFIMVTGQMPFSDKNRKKMMYKQLRGKVTYPDNRQVSQRCRTLISHLLEPNASLRYTIYDVFYNSWLLYYKKDVNMLAHKSNAIQHIDIGRGVNEDSKSEPFYDSKSDQKSYILTKDNSKESKASLETGETSNQSTVNESYSKFNKEEAHTKLYTFNHIFDKRYKHVVKLERSVSSLESDEDMITDTGSTVVTSLCRFPGVPCILEEVHKLEHNGKTEFISTHKTKPSHKGRKRKVTDSENSTPVSSRESFSVTSSTSVSYMFPDVGKQDNTGKQNQVKLVIEQKLMQQGKTYQPVNSDEKEVHSDTDVKWDSFKEARKSVQHSLSEKNEGCTILPTVCSTLEFWSDHSSLHRPVKSVEPHLTRYMSVKDFVGKSSAENTLSTSTSVFTSANSTLVNSTHTIPTLQPKQTSYSQLSEHTHLTKIGDNPLDKRQEQAQDDISLPQLNKTCIKHQSKNDRGQQFSKMHTENRFVKQEIDAVNEQLPSLNKEVVACENVLWDKQKWEKEKNNSITFSSKANIKPNSSINDHKCNLKTTKLKQMKHKETDSSNPQTDFSHKKSLEIKNRQDLSYQQAQNAVNKIQTSFLVTDKSVRPIKSKSSISQKTFIVKEKVTILKENDNAIKETTSNISESQTRVHQTSLVSQMRKLFESKETGTLPNK